MSIHGSCISVIVGVTAAPAISPNPRREHLILSPPGSGRVTLSPSAAVVIDGGLTLSAGMQPIRLCRHEIGELITQQWYAVGSAVNLTIGILEGDDHAEKSQGQPVTPGYPRRSNR